MTDIFNSSNADFIIQSSDGEQFRVYRCILSEASPFFKVLLSLPQPATTAVDDLDRSAPCPLVDVPENAQTVSTLLRLIYPVSEPCIDSLDELAVVLDAAVKYDMERAVDVLRRLLVSPQYLKEAPTRVYAIACRHELEKEAQIASEYTLSIDISKWRPTEDLNYIDDNAYDRLLEFRQKRSKAAIELIHITNDVRCVQCSSNYYGAICSPKWWYNYEMRAKEELVLRPISSVICSMDFLYKSAQFGCRRCALSILESQEFFAGLRNRIDALSSTI